MPLKKVLAGVMAFLVMSAPFTMNETANSLISDVISEKCYLLNSKKYSLSAQGLANSDVQETGNGINSNDAIVIQQYSLKLIDKLPV